MFICTFYHTPVAFCDRGIVFLYYEGGVADATPPQTVDKDPGSHSRIRVFVHNKFCNIVEILTFLVEFTV